MSRTYTEIVKRYRHSKKGKATHKAYINTPKEKVRTSERDFKNRRNLDTWKKYKITFLRSKSKKLGLEFNIGVEDLNVPEVCPVLGIPLILANQFKNQHAMKNPNVASVDRTDNTKGYIKGNIQIISNRANILKRDGTLEEFEALASYLRRLPLQS